MIGLPPRRSIEERRRPCRTGSGPTVTTGGRGCNQISNISTNAAPGTAGRAQWHGVLRVPVGRRAFSDFVLFVYEAMSLPGGGTSASPRQSSGAAFVYAVR